MTNEFSEHCDSYFKLYSSQYGHISYWPTPYNYHNWYLSIGEQYQKTCLHPTYYNMVYEYGGKMITKQKENKLSRGQKRRMKKKEMQEELEEEKKKIGNWVKYERKDLIQGIQKIQAKQKKEKQKKQNKLSHLIEIHKEVYKHHLKKSGAQNKKNRRVLNTNKKKRMSYIKQMKQIFENKVKLQKGNEKSQNTKQNQGKQTPAIVDEYVTDSQNEENTEQPKIIVKKLQISYDKIGKLTGKGYNGFYLREWVTNVPSQELEDIVLRLVNRLAYKQAIKKINTPEKAKKLIVSGIKECRRTLKTINEKKQAKFIILALNIERNNLQKGVDDEIQSTLQIAYQKKISIIHVSTRSKLGRAFTGKFGPRISMISIINYQGYQDMAQEMITKWNQAQIKYNQL